MVTYIVGEGICNWYVYLWRL